MALHDHWWTWVLRLPEGARAWGDQRFYNGSDPHGHVALHDHWCTRVQQLCRGRDHLDAPDQHRCCRLLRPALRRVRQRALCHRRLREHYQQREHHRRVPLQRYLPEPRDEVSRLSFRNKSFRFLILGKGEKAKSSNTKPKKKERKVLITPRSSKHYQRQSSKTRSPSTEWTRFRTTACTKISSTRTSSTASTERYFSWKHLMERQSASSTIHKPQWNKYGSRLKERQESQKSTSTLWVKEQSWRATWKSKTTEKQSSWLQRYSVVLKEKNQGHSRRQKRDPKRMRQNRVSRPVD